MVNRAPRLVFPVCFLCYAAAYFCRVNLAASAPYIMAAFGRDKVFLGFVAGGFFWAYAIGQLLNGVVGDKLPPRVFVALGMAAAGLSNIAIPFVGAQLLPFLWILNGFFQSMLWGPIVRVVSATVDEKRRNFAATALTTSTVVGYLAAYFIVGRLAREGWTLAFFVPGAVMAGLSVVWFFAVRVKPPVAPKTKRSGGFARFALNNGLLLLGAACLLHGVIKEVIAAWGPLMLSETYGLQYQNVLDWFALIPVVNFAGILLCSRLNGKAGGRTRRSLIILFAACGVTSLALAAALGVNFYADLALLALVSAAIFAINTLLLTFVPLDFTKDNRVSGTAGFMDCAVYLGAAVATPAAGFAADNISWRAVVAAWAAICALALAFVYFYKKGRKYENG